jgi:hypothetical protein
MLSNPDLIMCLWLVPVVSFLLLPLALATVGLPLIQARRFFFEAKTDCKETRKRQRFASSEDSIELPGGVTA